MESSRNVIKVNRDNKSTVRAPLDGVERWIDSRWPRSPLVMGIKQEGRTERSRWRQQVIGSYTGGMLVRLGDATSSRDYNNTGSLSLLHSVDIIGYIYIYIQCVNSFLPRNVFVPFYQTKEKTKTCRNSEGSKDRAESNEFQKQSGSRTIQTGSFGIKSGNRGMNNVQI